ncbi:MAG TPA: uracil/xanthine transporter [Bacillota bacterium]|nr:uracil/xanthine transporter [Bacillota bacterium]
MRELLKSDNWLSGLQWLFFIFTNTVVIPITVGAAFDLSQERITSLLQLSFIVTGLACMAQTLFGHKRAIMEGQSGLWWGVILTLCTTAAAQGMPLSVVGGSLAVGIIISGVLSAIIGLAGMGPYIAKLFNPSVMGVFMFLLGCQLVGIFLKGMLGIPFGQNSQSATIDLSVSLLSIVIAVIVIIITVKAPSSIRRYGLLIGIIIGWIAYSLFFGQQESGGQTAVNSSGIALFPLGKPAWDIGIIITAILTGLLNTANTFGSLKGTDRFYNTPISSTDYRSSFSITGIFIVLAGLLGLVPYTPYVSSIGFLSQTGIIKRLPLVLGGFLFLLMGVIPPVGHFFSMLPLSIGSAVLFVAYVQLLLSAWEFFQQVSFNTINIFRSSIPLFVGIVIMTMPASYFSTLPGIIRPLLSSGLLVGILLALVLENAFAWDRYGTSVDKTKSQ